GSEQVMIWRRSYDIQPPELEESQADARYGFAPPKTESLKNTLERVEPFWKEVIVPHIKQNKRILISAHGNSLRALIKHLDGVSDESIVRLTLPTAIPLVYELNENLQPIRHYYLGDEKLVEERIAQAEYRMYHL